MKLEIFHKYCQRCQRCNYPNHNIRVLRECGFQNLILFTIIHIIMPSRGAKDVNMTPVNIQRNGSINSKMVNGRRIMVALSSIHLTVGNSPRTVIGAKIIDAINGVPRK